MLFNSYSFFVFFAIVLITSRCISNWSWRKGFLLLVSYVFYAAWNPPFVILLWISTLVDWFAARNIKAAGEDRKRKVGWLILSLAVNLGMLGYFKYGGFFLENFTAVVQAMGISFTPAKPNIVLPVGISFYTFQTLSYTIDVYRGRQKPGQSFLDYALYVTFFPQLVAGPIVRASNFLPQCEAPKKGTAEQINWGLTLMVIGLFAKVVVADNLMAPIVDGIFAQSGYPSCRTAWVGAFAFVMQIFGDFFGYSTCAIGTALCLGFELPENFRFPYAAVGYAEFWQRWHISLSTWLRDYVMGSIRTRSKNPFRLSFNIMATMVIAGLWHGASWLFIIWGGIHGLYMVLERVVRSTKLANWPVWSKGPVRTCLALFTFTTIGMSMPFFRSTNLPQACRMVAAMFGLINRSADVELIHTGAPTVRLTAIVVLLMLVFHHMMRKSSLERLFGKMPWWLRSAIVAVLAYLTLTSMTGQDRAFIYFQF